MSANTITHGRALSVAASGAALVMAVFSAFVVDVGDSVRTFHGLLAAASALGALAPSMEVLVAARVLQGVAGGGILAAGLGSIGRAFPSGPARTHPTAVWGAAVGAGVMVGPLAGAGLVTVASCRTWRRRSARPGRHRSRRTEHRPLVPTPWAPPTPSKGLIFETAGREHPRTTDPH